MDLLLLAARNVLRQPRRSVLNGVILVVATAVMVIGLAWVAGYGRYIYGSVRDFETGDAQLLRAGYQAEAARLPVDLLMPRSAELREAALAEPEVGAASERLSVAARVTSGRRGHRVEGIGVRFRDEREVTTIADYIVAGSYPDDGLVNEAPAALLGRPVAEYLGVEPGDTVYVRAADADGVEDLVDFRVGGVFELGYAHIDRNRIFLELDTVRTLVRAGDSASRIVLRAAEGRAPAEARAAAERLAVGENSSGTGDADTAADLELEALGWRELASTVVAAVEADTAMFYLMLAVIFALGLFGMVNSVSVSVRERTREIATLRAVGMRRRTVVRLFAAEAAVLATVSVIVAFILASPLLWYWGTAGIDIAAHVPPELPIPFGERFRTVLRWGHLVGAAAVTIGVSVAAAVWPARGVARRSVAEALRSK